MISDLYIFLEHFITNEIDEVKSVDLFFDQFNEQFDGKSDNRSNPRILIEMNEFEPIQIIGHIQEWVADITLHIGIDIYNTVYSGSELKDKNLEYLRLLDTIYQKLSGLSSYNLPDELKSDSYKFHNVQRSRILFSTTAGNIKVSEIGLKLIVEDGSLAIAQETSTINTINTTITI